MDVKKKPLVAHDKETKNKFVDSYSVVVVERERIFLIKDASERSISRDTLAKTFLAFTSFCPSSKVCMNADSTATFQGTSGSA